ncbi:MAG: purine-nucleoside phosphorylase [Oligoflexia bacterium]|nr:purine-nucleoside phosphorylase [Oligoflexia bacterium]
MNFSHFLEKKQIEVPAYHIVLGSGFGEALNHLDGEQLAELSFAEVDGLVPSTVPDHKGVYRFYKVKGKTISFQMGRLHGYEGHSPQQVARTVILPRLAGVKKFLLTNASGGLSLAYRPGDVMLIRDHVNLTGANPLMGENPKDSKGKELGPRFPDMNTLYSQPMRKKLEKSFQKQKLKVHEGTYLGVLGPSFETPAEVQLYAAWGMHAVGMSTVWESIALRHSGAELAGISLISNLGAGMDPNASLDHLQIIETCRESAAKIIRGISDYLQEAL